MIRLGLIGAGAWGKNYITAAKESGVAEVVWTAGRDWENVAAQAAHCDAIVVATSPQGRPELCRRVSFGYMHGRQDPIPLMIEKPICLSSDEAISIGYFSSPICLVDYVHLFSPAYEHLRLLVRERPGRLRIYGRSAGPTVRDYSLLWDHACHDLAMCLGFGLELSHPAVAHRVDDSTEEMDVNFSDNAIAHIRAGLRPGKKRQLSVLCGSWSAVYDGVVGTLDVNGVRVVTDTEYPLTRAVRAFAQAVKDGGTDDWRFGIDASVAITRVLEDAQARMSVPRIPVGQEKL